MRMSFFKCVVIAFYSLVIHLATAQDNPQAIVKKAIAAHGGEEKIARLNRVHSKAEGTIDMLPGQPAMPFAGENWRMDGDSKMTVSIRVQGIKMVVTDAIQGDTQWRQLQGITQELSKEEVAEIQESRYVDRLAKLGFLKDDAIALATLPESKIGDKPALGILATSQGRRNVKLYFDKATGLLSKVEHPALDLLSGKEVMEELVLSDYQDKDGLKYAMRSTIYRDGKKIMDGKVTELKLVDTLDRAIFARP